MEHLVGPDWKDYFDVLVVQARKPRFFTDISRPMRVFDERSGTHIWDRVNKLEKGIIYYEVSYSVIPIRVAPRPDKVGVVPLIDRLVRIT